MEIGAGEPFADVPVWLMVYDPTCRLVKIADTSVKSNRHRLFRRHIDAPAW